MIYRVKAKFNFDKAQKFYKMLTGGYIEKQRPDGPEMVSSMKRATMDENGDINWTEMCFCPTPLQHERATFYDDYFTEMETDPISDHEVVEGKSFMQKLSTFQQAN